MGSLQQNGLRQTSRVGLLPPLHIRKLIPEFAELWALHFVYLLDHSPEFVDVVVGTFKFLLHLPLLPLQEGQLLHKIVDSELILLVFLLSLHPQLLCSTQIWAYFCSWKCCILRWAYCSLSLTLSIFSFLLSRFSSFIFRIFSQFFLVDCLRCMLLCCFMTATSSLLLATSFSLTILLSIFFRFNDDVSTNLLFFSQISCSLASSFNFLSTTGMVLRMRLLMVSCFWDSSWAILSILNLRSWREFYMFWMFLSCWLSIWEWKKAMEQLQPTLLFYPKIITALLSLMSENLLPDIQVKIGKHEHSIHALNRHMRRKMNINKGDLLRPSLALKGHAHSQNYLVRLSFSNKTVVYKRRAPPIDREREQDGEEGKAVGQCHQSNRIVILKQSCRYDTEQECQELKACRSLLNTKAKPKNQLFEGKKKKYSLNCQKERHRSLIEMDYQKMRKTKNDEFELLPWQDQETKTHKNKRIDDRALQPRRFL